MTKKIWIVDILRDVVSEVKFTANDILKSDFVEHEHQIGFKTSSHQFSKKIDAHAFYNQRVALSNCECVGYPRQEAAND